MINSDLFSGFMVKTSVNLFATMRSVIIDGSTNGQTNYVSQGYLCLKMKFLLDIHLLVWNDIKRQERGIQLI